jgi:peptidoglycan/xylan/chitin deacetylase (PgdA/CDA1 family)
MLKTLFVLLFSTFLIIVASCSNDMVEKTADPSEGIEEEVTSENQTEDNVKDNQHQKDVEKESSKEDKKADDESTSDIVTNEKQSEISPQYRINEKNWQVEPIQGANEKVVLLTIDDAPDKYGLQMAEKLKELGVNAIFFVNGHFIDTTEEREILKKIYELGFPIGNHTWNHSNLKKLSEQDQHKEISSLSDEIENITGERPEFFRAPFGANTDYARKLVIEEGMILMNWSYGYDFVKDYMTKEKIADIMINTPLLKNGSNLLMHDREWTFLALEEIVAGLKEKGYEFVDPHLIETHPASK